MSSYEKFTIYSKPNCTFCAKAKVLMQNNNLQYFEVDLTQDQKTLDRLKELGCRTVPQIFSPEDEHIGGYDDLVKFVENFTQTT